jgi:CHAD domain-containing protein
VSESNHEERELKFTPEPRFRLAAVADLDAELRTEAAETLHLHATYYDTTDLRLARAGASLRYRNDGGWTVKLPKSSDVALVRSELHVDGDEREVPTAAVDLVRALIRHAPLQRVARLDTVRHRVLLRSHDGEQLAELVDDEVSVSEAPRSAAAFRELEVEFTDAASPELVQRVADELRHAGAGEPQHISKIVRALGPRALDAPDLVGPGDLDFASTPTEVLRAAIARSTARLLAHDPGVRLGGDAEDVHQARVATRRIRSDLRTFRPAVDPGWDESLRTELKWLAGLLGAVRDADVLLERLEGRVDALPERDHQRGQRLLDVLRAERARDRDELLAAMRSERYLDLIERLLAASRAVPASTDGADIELELGDLVKKPWKKLRKAVHDLGDDPPDPALHAVRIRAKRVRYAAEAVAPAVGKDARKFAKAIARLQEVLGDHQDAVVAAQWLRDNVPAGDGGAAFVAGELAVREDEAARASRAEWEDAWETARHRSLREWM